MDEKERLRKIGAAQRSLMENHSATELRAMHEHAFGIASKTKDKARLAKKLAEWTVDGAGTEESSAKKEKAPAKAKASTKSKAQPAATPAAPPSTSKPKNVSSKLSDEELAKMAKGILGRAKTAWFELADLKKAKREKLAKFSKVIKDTRDKIQNCLADDAIPETKKLSLVEGHWRNLRKAEEKKEVVRTDFAERIATQKQIVESEFDNTNQLNLFD
jgi:hypothetical protein